MKKLLDTPAYISTTSKQLEEIDSKPSELTMLNGSKFKIDEMEGGYIIKADDLRLIDLAWLQARRKLVYSVNGKRGEKKIVYLEVGKR